MSEDLHGNTPDDASVALLIIDMLNDFAFPDGEALLQSALQAAERIAPLASRARAVGIPVIYANDNFGRWRSDFRQVVGHVLDGDSGGQSIAALLHPRPEDYFVLKPKHSAFYATPLDLLLQHLGCERLILSGLSTEQCVLVTAGEAHTRGFELHVPADCVAGASQEASRQALHLMQRAFGADISLANALDLDALAAGRNRADV